MRSRKLGWVRALAGLSLLLLAAGVVALWPRPDRITKASYGRIKGGMIQADVEAILGPPNCGPSRIQELLDTDDLSKGDVGIMPSDEGVMRAVMTNEV